MPFYIVILPQSDLRPCSFFRNVIKTIFLSKKLKLSLIYDFSVNVEETLNSSHTQIRMLLLLCSYRVSQKTWEFSDAFDIVFVMN